MGDVIPINFDVSLWRDTRVGAGRVSRGSLGGFRVGNSFRSREMDWTWKSTCKPVMLQLNCWGESSRHMAKDFRVFSFSMISPVAFITQIVKCASPDPKPLRASLIIKLRPAMK